MGHAQKRLALKVKNAAKVAAVSTVHLPKFPPPEALRPRNLELPTAPFEPETWADAQSPPPSALSAFAHRIGLASVLTSTELIQQACTHSSFVSLHQHHFPDLPKPATNAQLATIGNSLMGLFATEHINATYPYLPTRVLKAAVTAHVGPMSCASVAQEMGAAPLLRWRRTVRCLHVHFHSVKRLTLTIAKHSDGSRSAPSRRPFYYTTSNHRPDMPETVPPLCP